MKVGLVLAFALGFAGCRSLDAPQPETSEVVEADLTLHPRDYVPDPPAPARTPATLEFGNSVEGRPLHYIVLPPEVSDLEPGKPPRETILILATIHGDESAGTALCEMLITTLLHEPALLAGRRVVIAPTVNPDGVAKRRRTNANNVDLNRNFDAANWGSSHAGSDPLSEPETRALVDLWERFQPDRVVSFHQPVNLVDYDGPALAFAQAVGAAGELRVQHIGSRPGSFGSFVGVDNGTPILTVELPARAERNSDGVLWQRFGALMRTCVTWSPE
jgi:murein peptide amidase A